MKKRVDGLFLFDKPKNVSSNCALQRVKRLFQAEKAGHVGTLDPLATGLLPICFGEATKFSVALLDGRKVYSVEMRLGSATDTFDEEGQVVARSDHVIKEGDFSRVVASLIGELTVLPPVYSAVKIAGRPSYEWIRKYHIHKELTARRTVIYDIAVLHFEFPLARIRITCSKGTYVRSLVHEVGTTLKCYAHVKDLRREGVGKYNVMDAHSWDELQASCSALDLFLLPLDDMTSDLPALWLGDARIQQLYCGQKIPMQLQEAHFLENQVCTLYSISSKKFFGLVRLSDSCWIPIRMISSA